MTTDRGAASVDDDDTDGFFGSLLAEEESWDRRTLLRLGTWAVAAIAALVIAIVLNRSSFAERRLGMVTSADLAQQTQRIQWVSDNSQAEARRLSAAAETLQHDRDRLFIRVTSLEQTLAALQTAGALNPPPPEPKSPAVSAVETPPAQAAPSAETKTEAQPAATVADRPATDGTPAATRQAASNTTDPAPTGSIDKSSAVAAPPDKAQAAPATAAPETPVERTEFGVDLGTASSMQALRVLWSTIRQSNPALLGSMRPIVAMKERSNGLGLQLRLIAGPLTDAAAAARLCAALAIRNHECDTAVFDGQRLSTDNSAAAETKSTDTAKPASPPPAAKRTTRRRAAVRPQQQPAPPPPSSSPLSRLVGR